MFDRHASDWLAAYLDGKIEGDRRARVEAHLTGCGRCREELEQIRMARSALELLPVASAPDELWNAIDIAADSVRRPRGFRVVWQFAAAAVLLVMLSGGYWIWSRRPVSVWEVVALDGSPIAGSRQLSGTGAVRSGESIETDSASRARILIGGIGSVVVEPDTQVRLVSTSASGHRLALRRGGISASISAPPRLFMVDTPAGTAVDLGCEYQMRCDRDGSGTLRVTAGWVAMEWRGRDSLVPAGACCRLYPGRGPGTPWFEDAPPALVAALDQFDRKQGALDVILAQARTRDTLTLWHLLSQVDGKERVRVFERMVTLAPLPATVRSERVLELDTESLKKWREELAWIW